MQILFLKAGIQKHGANILKQEMASSKVKYIALETPDLAGRLRQPHAVLIGIFTTCNIPELCSTIR